MQQAVETEREAKLRKRAELEESSIAITNSWKSRIVCIHGPISDRRRRCGPPLDWNSAVCNLTTWPLFSARLICFIRFMPVPDESTYSRYSLRFLPQPPKPAGTVFLLLPPRSVRLTTTMLLPKKRLTLIGLWLIQKMLLDVDATNVRASEGTGAAQGRGSEERECRFSSEDLQRRCGEHHCCHSISLRYSLVEKCSKLDSEKPLLKIHFKPLGSRGGVREELRLILSTVEKALKSRGLTWGSALYIRLFLDDMASFGTANREYVKHITEQKCERGVASQCCMQVCLPEAGMGGVLLEVTAASDSSKQVLHVQSISCWAPCCIGPYNQAVKNCEAVAQAFKASLRRDVVGITIYCSNALSDKDQIQVERCLYEFLGAYMNSSVLT